MVKIKSKLIALCRFASIADKIIIKTDEIDYIGCSIVFGAWTVGGTY